MSNKHERRTPQQKIGSIAWLRETQGKMTLRSRLALLRQVLAPGVGGVIKSLFRSGRNHPLALADIPMPDSAGVKHALEELESCASPGIIQHSFRTYLWGAGFAQIDQLQYDPESLLVGCLLHDLGMTARHHGQYARCSCFAGDSAIAAAAVMRRAGWAEDRIEPVADMISLHMNGHMTPADGHEAYLLQQGTACDVVGARYYDFQSTYRQAILQKHPREKLNREFINFMAKEKLLRPDSRAALLAQVGLPLMIKLNPYAE